MKWYHYVILLFLGFLVGLSLASNAGAQDLDIMQQQVVRIETPSGVGTGVVVGPNTIITAKHVVQNEEGKLEAAFYVQSVNGRIKISSNVQLIDGVDVAIIHGAALGIKPASISCDELKQGDDIATGGYTLDIMYMYSRGYISGQYLYEDFYYLAYIPGNHGNSGGPVYNKAGELIAIFVGGIIDKEKEGATINVLAAMAPICNQVKKGIY